MVKRVSTLVLLAAGAVSFACAQQPSLQPLAQQRHKPQVRQALPPPRSTRAHTSSRESTARVMAARRNRPPLEELPAFSVLNLDNKTETTKDFSRKGHWLLVYQRAHCVPCDQELATLAASASPLMKHGLPYVIVVTAPTADALARVKAGYPLLSDATWVADASHSGWKALKLRTAPVMYAMRGDKIAFTVPGLMGNPAMVEKMASAWLERKDADDLKSVTTSREAQAKLVAAAAAAANRQEATKKK